MFTPNPGEMIQFDYCIFNHQLGNLWKKSGEKKHLPCKLCYEDEKVRLGMPPIKAT